MWLMPFLLRATPRQDLTGWTLRSEVNHHGDRAFERHTRPDPERYENRWPLTLHHILYQGNLLVTASWGSRTPAEGCRPGQRDTAQPFTHSTCGSKADVR